MDEVPHNCWRKRRRVLGQQNKYAFVVDAVTVCHMVLPSPTSAVRLRRAMNAEPTYERILFIRENGLS